MNNWLRLSLLVAAGIILLLTFINASWLADAPPGAIRLIAHRGVAQHFDRQGLTRETCSASRIEPPVHNYLENTTRSMEASRRLGADLVAIDIAPTADGRLAIFHDRTLDCRTNGKGEVRTKTLAELQSLDVGYGYSGDGGKSFPFRGHGGDRIPALEEALAALTATPILFHFESGDAAEADRLAATLKAADRDVKRTRDAFYGPAAPVGRIKQHFPEAWAWSLEGASRCTRDYLLYGWAGMVPESCRNGTIIVPINRQWMFAGWPNRLIGRMSSVGAKVVVSGAGQAGGPITGLLLPEQLGKIPSTFKGYIWVEDIWAIGPALRPHRDFRTEPQRQAAAAGLERRRERMD